MLETSWLWFVISKEYVELTRPKIESRDPIFFTGTRSRSRVSGNDRLFPRGSEFGPNHEIPARPAIQLRPGPGTCSNEMFTCPNFRSYCGPPPEWHKIFFGLHTFLRQQIGLQVAYDKIVLTASILYNNHANFGLRGTPFIHERYRVSSAEAKIGLHIIIIMKIWPPPVVFCSHMISQWNTIGGGQNSIGLHNF